MNLGYVGDQIWNWVINNFVELLDCFGMMIVTQSEFHLNDELRFNKHQKAYLSVTNLLCCLKNFQKLETFNLIEDSLTLVGTRS
ncbi:CLUMA_CG019716, isoform A [Clunio marinus]|uniref:CLUMA_CG019716, isoform A n=1 Tax=Clunio marinus TaxID=568069 RepID=A0A1J1J7K6_9DIPT|nr:CLUMA_CG019716, isoform A [Clunio marinus]